MAITAECGKNVNYFIEKLIYIYLQCGCARRDGLNPTLNAVSAGEQGRGLAMVAYAVCKLAQGGAVSDDAQGAPTAYLAVR